jgi:transposase
MRSSVAELEPVHDRDRSRLLRHHTPSAPRRHPDWAAVHRKLRPEARDAVDPLREIHRGRADGYLYSRFCELYRAWQGRLSVTARQTHAAGDKLFTPSGSASQSGITPPSSGRGAEWRVQNITC